MLEEKHVSDVEKEQRECKHPPKKMTRYQLIAELAQLASYAVHDEACAIIGKGMDDIDAEFCTCGFIQAVLRVAGETASNRDELEYDPRSTTLELQASPLE